MPESNANNCTTMNKTCATSFMGSGEHLDMTLFASDIFRESVVSTKKDVVDVLRVRRAPKRGRN